MYSAPTANPHQFQRAQEDMNDIRRVERVQGVLSWLPSYAVLSFCPVGQTHGRPTLTAQPATVLLAKRTLAAVGRIRPSLQRALYSDRDHTLQRTTPPPFQTVRVGLHLCSIADRVVSYSGIFGYVNYLVEKDRKFIIDTLINGMWPFVSPQSASLGSCCAACRLRWHVSRARLAASFRLSDPTTESQR
jgi:hypothetical protein